MSLREDCVSDVSCRQDDCAAFSEADARRALTLTPAAQDDFIAILEEAARLARRKLDRLRASPCQFHQRSSRVLRVSGHGSTGEEISRSQIAAAGRVMRNELSDRPVQVAETPATEPERFHVFLAHLVGL